MNCSVACRQARGSAERSRAALPAPRVERPPTAARTRFSRNRRVTIQSPRIANSIRLTIDAAPSSMAMGGSGIFRPS